MANTGKKALVVLLIAVFLAYQFRVWFASQEIDSIKAYDCFGNEYEETLSLRELERALENYNRGWFSWFSWFNWFGESDDKLVARLLARTKDKDQMLFGKVTISDLLVLTKNYRDMTFCERIKFESFKRTCEQVSSNIYLSNYCKQNIDRLYSECSQITKAVYNELSRQDIYSTFLNISKNLSAYIADHGNPWDSPKKSVEKYMNAPEVPQRDKDVLAILCAMYNGLVHEILLYFDKDGEFTFKGKEVYKLTLDRCAHFGQWKWGSVIDFYISLVNRVQSRNKDKVDSEILILFSNQLIQVN